MEIWDFIQNEILGMRWLNRLTAAAEMRAAYKVGFKDGAAMMREIQD